MIIRLDHLSEVRKRVELHHDRFYGRGKKHAISLPVSLPDGVNCTAFSVLAVSQAAATIVLGPMDHNNESWSIASEFSGTPPAVGSVLFCNLESGMCQVRPSVGVTPASLIAYSKNQVTLG